MRKATIIITIILLICVGIFGTSALANESDNTENDQAAIEWSFDEFKSILKDDISQQDLQKAEELFNKAITLENEEKYDEADKVWDELFSMDIFNEDMMEEVEWTFDNFKTMLKDDISPQDLKKAEDLFNEAIALENEEKYDEADKVWDELFSMDIFNEDMMEEIAWTFDDFKTMLNDDISQQELQKAEELFNKAIALENDEKYDAADKVWDELFSMDIFNEDMMEEVAWTFDDFKTMLKDDISSQDMQKAEELFNKAIALESEEKYDEADKVWDELFSMDIFNEEYMAAIECDDVI